MAVDVKLPSSFYWSRRVPQIEPASSYPPGAGKRCALDHRRLAEVGTVIRTRTPEEFGASFEQDFETAGRLIRGAGVEPE